MCTVPRWETTLRVGMLGGLMGSAEILSLSRDELILRTDLDSLPPEKLPLTLLLSLPRPKMLKRILQTVASMGVARLVLMNSYRVEKSFWDSPWLQPAVMHEQLLLGLEQARDTVLPEILIEPLFKPFVEDRLPANFVMARAVMWHIPAYIRALSGCPESTANTGNWAGRRLYPL
jgi:16S rRNA U1498 N3-methylase RsmE